MISLKNVEIFSYISVREQEDFLDIPVSVVGNANLELGLTQLYIIEEQLDGTNQYHCDQCKCLVDATKV